MMGQKEFSENLRSKLLNWHWPKKDEQKSEGKGELQGTVEPVATTILDIDSANFQIDYIDRLKDSTTFRSKMSSSWVGRVEEEDLSYLHISTYRQYKVVSQHRTRSQGVYSGNSSHFSDSSHSNHLEQSTKRKRKRKSKRNARPCWPSAISKDWGCGRG